MYNVKEIAKFPTETLERLSFSADEQAKIDLFEDGLAACKPAMFHLADNVIADYPMRQWNVLIGDDTSGRLPTTFLRHVVRESGIYLPTFYVCGSLAVRKSLTMEPYMKYASKIEDSMTSPMKALIVSESAGTGQTLQFLQRLFSSEATLADIAVLGVSNQRIFSKLTGNVYYGDSGETILQDTFRTFEAVQPSKSSSLAREIAKRIMPRKMRRKLRGLAGPSKSTTYPFTGVEVPRIENPEDTPPIAVSATDKRYRRVTHYAHFRMSDLAKEYTENRRSDA